MTLAAVLTLLTLVAVLALLVWGRWGADAVLLGALAFLLVAGVVDARRGFAGFANEGMLTVGALFVVAAGLRQTGAMSRVAAGLLGPRPIVRVALTRLVGPVAVGSAFLNNTPIVAAMLPAVTGWARRHRLPASRLLLPLSYATILGGTITMIGTSTNLVVGGLVEQAAPTHAGLTPLGIFSIAPVGLALAAVGCGFLVLLAPRILPDRRPAISRDDDPREYTTELVVRGGSALVDRTIEAAGLRNLPGAYLMEIDRGPDLLVAVEPTTRLRGGDRLVFVGPRDAVLELTRIDGLEPASDQRFELDSPDDHRCLVEAVVAPSNPLVGGTIRDGHFRATFNAVVIAVARDGRRVPGRIGDIVLEAGDVLLLEVHPSWMEAHGDRREFYLASAVEDSSSFRPRKAWIALVILVAMVGAAALGVASMFEASLLAAFAMVAVGACSPLDARSAVDWPTLIAIAASFGLGEAIRQSGADELLAGALVTAGATTPLAALVVLYVGTAVCTEMITNNAAAALMFPFALTVADRLGVSPMPFVVAVMFAASASFATPIGYQTNLMVYGPGGYRFTDYLRLGVPLQVLAAAVTLTTIPLVFPF